MRIYLASSWRNIRQPFVLQALREAGHDVYDFRNPPGAIGFSWNQLELGAPAEWSSEFYVREVLSNPRARAGFEIDMSALRGCEACVLVLPCGRSAHLELGWASGQGKRTYVLVDDQVDEPELMYLMCDAVCLTVAELLHRLTGGGPLSAAPRQFYPGDTVRSLPADEEWVVAFQDDDGWVTVAGWPPGQVRASDLQLVERATPEQFVSMLRALAASRDGRRSEVGARLLREFEAAGLPAEVAS